MKTVGSIAGDFQVSETILLLEADQEFGERKNVEEVREAEYFRLKMIKKSSISNDLKLPNNPN